MQRMIRGMQGMPGMQMPGGRQYAPGHASALIVGALAPPSGCYMISRLSDGGLLRKPFAKRHLS